MRFTCERPEMPTVKAALLSREGAERRDVLGPSNDFNSVATTAKLYALNGHWSPQV